VIVNNIRRVSVAVLPVAVLPILVALASPSPAPASPATIKLVAFSLASDELPTHSRYVSRLSTPAGVAAGNALWTCVRTARHRFRCTDTYTLSGGKLTAVSTTATTEYPYPKATRKITAGTGTYAGAAGTVAIRLMSGNGEAGSRYSVTISLR